MAYQKYLPPSGYRKPPQAYSKFGYDGNTQLYLPGRVGPTSVVMPGASSGFNGDFAALALSFNLTVRAYFRSDLGISGTTGSGFSTWDTQYGDSSGMVPGTGASDGIGTVVTGLGGKSAISGNGATQNGVHAFASVAPATVNQHEYGIDKFLVTPAASGVLFGGDALQICSYVNGAQTSPAANVQQYNGGGGALTTGVVINQWYRHQFSFTGSVNDTFKVGAHSPAPTLCPNNISTARRGFLSTGTGASRLSSATLMRMYIDGPLITFNAFALAADALLSSVWGAGIET